MANDRLEMTVLDFLYSKHKVCYPMRSSAIRSAGIFAITKTGGFSESGPDPIDISCYDSIAQRLFFSTEYANQVVTVTTGTIPY